MRWYAEVIYRDGRSDKAYCTTRQEARDYARRVRNWADVVSVTIRKVGK